MVRNRRLTRCSAVPRVIALLIVFVSVSPGVAQVSVTTWHNDIGRTGQNIAESTLTTSKVTKTTFGKVCSATVDGQVYAQPLTLWDTANSRNIVYVVTQNDSVYAFDGRNCSSVGSNRSLLPSSESPADCALPGMAQASGAAPASPAPSNPLKIALLKWYKANLATTFPVGKQPLNIAFDGANMWVTNNYDGTVTKLRANDGARLGTFPVGAQPVGVAFDGANIWVANSASNNVTKLRASDGANLGTFTVGSDPLYVAFDGESIWVTNGMGASITKLRAKDGAVLGTFADAGGPGGIAFDGTYVWVTNFNDTVTRFKRDGTNAGSFTVGAQPYGIAFDGANIWVGNVNSTSITKLRASDGTTLGTFSLSGSPYGVAFDGVNIWVTASSVVEELRSSDGAIVGSFLLGTSPSGLAFDGANVWVVNYDANTISKM